MAKSPNGSDSRAAEPIDGFNETAADPGSPAPIGCVGSSDMPIWRYCEPLGVRYRASSVAVQIRVFGPEMVTVADGEPCACGLFAALDRDNLVLGLGDFLIASSTS